MHLIEKTLIEMKYGEDYFEIQLNSVETISLDLCYVDQRFRRSSS